MRCISKNLVVVMISVVSLSAGVTGGALRSEKWTSRKAWDELKIEMSESQVVELLGEPREKVTGPRSCTWYYQQVPAENEPPFSGSVKLKKVRVNGLVSLEVFDYEEPDWQLLQAQLEAEQLAVARAKEQARLEKERIAAEKQLELQKRQEQIKQDNIAKKQEAEVRAAERKKNLEALQLKRERERAELRSYKPKSLAARYFLVLGIAFAGGAIVFAVMRRIAEK